MVSLLITKPIASTLQKPANCTVVGSIINRLHFEIFLKRSIWQHCVSVPWVVTAQTDRIVVARSSETTWCDQIEGHPIRSSHSLKLIGPEKQNTLISLQAAVHTTNQFYLVFPSVTSLSQCQPVFPGSHKPQWIFIILEINKAYSDDRLQHNADLKVNFEQVYRPEDNVLALSLLYSKKGKLIS